MNTFLVCSLITRSSLVRERGKFFSIVFVSINWWTSWRCLMNGLVVNVQQSILTCHLFHLLIENTSSVVNFFRLASSSSRAISRDWFLSFVLFPRSTMFSLQCCSLFSLCVVPWTQFFIRRKMSLLVSWTYSIAYFGADIKFTVEIHIVVFLSSVRWDVNNDSRAHCWHDRVGCLFCFTLMLMNEELLMLSSIFVRFSTQSMPLVLIYDWMTFPNDHLFCRYEKLYRWFNTLIPVSSISDFRRHNRHQSPSINSNFLASLWPFVQWIDVKPTISHHHSLHSKPKDGRSTVEQRREEKRSKVKFFDALLRMLTDHHRRDGVKKLFLDQGIYFRLFQDTCVAWREFSLQRKIVFHGFACHFWRYP